MKQTTKRRSPKTKATRFTPPKVKKEKCKNGDLILLAKDDIIFEGEITRIDLDVYEIEAKFPPTRTCGAPCIRTINLCEDEYAVMVDPLNISPETEDLMSYLSEQSGHQIFLCNPMEDDEGYTLMSEENFDEVLIRTTTVTTRCLSFKGGKCQLETTQDAEDTTKRHFLIQGRTFEEDVEVEDPDSEWL